MSSSALAVGAGIEIAKLLVQAYMMQVQLAGLNPEQTETLYQAEKARFLSRDPSQLPVIEGK
jgi:hypothetical protein